MLKSGWSHKDISTDEPFIIPGQFRVRISKGCHDPIMLTALTLYGDEDYVIFLQCDLIGNQKGFLEDIFENVKKRNADIDVSKILINATHTHSSPRISKTDNYDGWWSASFLKSKGYKVEQSAQYTEFVIKSAAEAICESFENKENGSISYGYGFAVVGHNRRVVYSKDWAESGGEINARIVDGHAKMYGNTDDESFSHYESGADYFTNFVFTFDENERLTGAIINVPCPAQNSENEHFVSADYWHDVRSLIKEKYGDIHILAQCAAGGDMSPRILHYQKAQSRRYKLKFSDRKLNPMVKHPDEMYSRWDIAIRICESFDEVLSWASKEKYSDLSISHSVKTIELDKRMITPGEYEFCKEELERLEKTKDGADEKNLIEMSKISSSISRCKGVLMRYNSQKTEPTLSMQMHVISIGDIAFVTNGFELYVDFQHQIQANSPFLQTFVVQLCAQPQRGGGSYVATERALENVGYGATMYCNLVSPEGGRQIVRESIKELNRLYKKRL